MEPTETQGQDNTKLLAGLCYIPVLLINIIAILYVLITGKGGRFAKFHALQGLFFYIAYMALVIILEVPILFLMGDMFRKLPRSGETIFDVWTGMFTIMLPTVVLGMAYLLVSVYLAVMVLQGKDMRIPVIGKLVSNFMKE